MAKRTAKANGPGKPGPKPRAWPSDIPLPIESVARLVDAGMKSLVRFAKAGDALAAQRLHEWLAEDLRKGTLTPYGMNLLASMHEGLASGEAAADAMFTAKSSNRSINARRDRELFMVVQFALSAASTAGKSRTMTAVYEEVGAMFNIKAKTAKLIYLRMKRELVARPK